MSHIINLAALLRVVARVSGIDKASSRCAEIRVVKSIDSGHTPPWGEEAMHLSWCNRVRGLHKKDMMGSSSSQSQRRCLTKGCSSREMSRLYPSHHLSTEVIQVGVGEPVQDLRNTKTPHAFRRSAQLPGSLSVDPRSNRYIPRSLLIPANHVSWSVEPATVAAHVIYLSSHVLRDHTHE